MAGVTGALERERERIVPCREEKGDRDLWEEVVEVKVREARR